MDGRLVHSLGVGLWALLGRPKPPVAVFSVYGTPLPSPY